MKTLTNYLLAASFAVVSFSSVQAQYSPSPDVANPDNPFDQAGALHNEGVTAVGNALNWNRNNYTPERLYGEVGRFLDGKGVTKNFAQLYSQAKGDFDGILQRGGTISNQWITDQGVSAKGLKYFNEGLTIIENQNIPTLKEFSGTFRKLEITIKNDSQLSDKDRGALLSSMSVARYSYDYWEQFYRVPKSGPKMINTKSLSRLGFFSILKADYIGEFAGAIGGAIGGAITGGLAGGPAGAGVGAGAGAGVGAVAGAISNSLSAAGQ